MRPTPSPRARRRAGFSLAELMVVIVIIGLLATLVVPNVVRKLKVAFGGKVKADIIAIEDALNEYAVMNGRYPDSLEALVTPDEQGYTILNRTTIPLDPWKNEYQYEPPSGTETRPRIYTLGADGAPGGEGEDADIDNWSIRDEQ